MNNINLNDNKDTTINPDALIKALIAKKEQDKVIEYIKPTLDNLKNTIFDDGVFA